MTLSADRALMRLVVQAQELAKQHAVVESFARLATSDVHVLSEEMARTGARGQEYSRSKPVDADRGPAILVYYSPAFVRHLAPSHTDEALTILAEVYRRSRELWPLQVLPRLVNGSHKSGRRDRARPSEEIPEMTTPTAGDRRRPEENLAGGVRASSGAAADGGTAAGGTGGAPSHVTIRIDQIKEQNIEAIRGVYSHSEVWVLLRRNELEGVVERHPETHLRRLVAAGEAVKELRFREEHAVGAVAQ